MTFHLWTALGTLIPPAKQSPTALRLSPWSRPNTIISYQDELYTQAIYLFDQHVCAPKSPIIRLHVPMTPRRARPRTEHARLVAQSFPLSACLSIMKTTLPALRPCSHHPHTLQDAERKKKRDPKYGLRGTHTATQIDPLSLAQSRN